MNGYLIQSGKRFLTSWCEVSGRPFWTTDRAEAKRFAARDRAEEIADGIGRVVKA